MSQPTPLIMVSAPSGAGKSSFVDRICSEDDRIVDVITHTARAPRRGESQGIPYHFVSPENFESLITENFFIEYARVHGCWYGTSHAELQKAWANGKWCIMDVDVQGAATFRKKFPSSKSVFILPPSLEVLQARIVARDGRVPADLDVRLANAEIEMKCATNFDFQVMNDDFEQSYQKFKKIVEDIMGAH